MSVAYIILAHDHLARAGALAAHLARDGAPVAVHLDRRADATAFETALDGAPALRIRPRRAEWGMWPLVGATLDGLAALRAEPGWRHVALLSGADLPLRGAADLRAFLDDRRDLDFIESVDPTVSSWVRGGLCRERFEYYFPVSWRRHRRAFDALVAAQRRLGLRRKPPLAPRIGAQWWCLSRRTAEAILDDPDLPRLIRWFRRTWTPDESFFQSLAARHADPGRIAGHGLTFARFDAEGRPHVFYDDHLAALEASDWFFARKIWPGADRLYARFLGDPPARGAGFGRRPPAIAFDDIEARARAAPPGLRHAGRAPRLSAERMGATAAPYKVFVGVEAAFAAPLRPWLAHSADIAVHGRIFAGGGFAGDGGADARLGPGGLSNAPAIRAISPERLLASLIGAGRSVQGVCLAPEDDEAIWSVIADDPNAALIVLRDAWALGGDIAPEAARRAMRRERDMLRRCAPGRIALIDPAALLAGPEAEARAALARACREVNIGFAATPPPLPARLPAEPLAHRFRRLRARGFDVSAALAAWRPAPVATLSGRAAIGAAGGG